MKKIMTLAFGLALCCTSISKDALSKEEKTLNTGEVTHTMKIELESSAFQSGHPIPALYTADGHDVSPPLQWRLSGNGNAAGNVHSFALICDDPDAPMGTWVHWIIYGIPSSTNELKEGVPAAQSKLPDGSRQGKNSWNKIGYGGPSPPPGKPHRYFFKISALDEPLRLPPGATKQQLTTAMQGHVVSEAEFMGTYGR